MFSGLEIMRLRWPIIGHLDNWDRSRWPMPTFVRRPLLEPTAYLVTYSEVGDLQELAQNPCSAPGPSYPEDGLWGGIFTENRLSDLIDHKETDNNEQLPG